MYMAQSSAANAQILSLNNQLYMTRYIRNYLANDANRTQLGAGMQIMIMLAYFLMAVGNVVTI